jgi:hypothetical protein
VLCAIQMIIFEEHSSLLSKLPTEFSLHSKAFTVAAIQSILVFLQKQWCD